LSIPVDSGGSQGQLGVTRVTEDRGLRQAESPFGATRNEAAGACREGARCRSTGPQGYVNGSSRAFHSFAFGYFAGRVPRIERPSNSPSGAPSAFMKAPKLAPCAVRSPEW